MATRVAPNAARQAFSAAWLVAKTLGVLCGPTIVPFWLAGLLVEATGRPLGTVDLLLFVGSLGVFPGLLVIAAYLTGRASDLDLSVHAERRTLVGLGAVGAAAGCGALAWRGADPFLVALAVGAAGQAILLALLTARDKVSYHGAAGAGLAAAGFWLTGPALGTALGLLALATGWSRLYLHRHTLRQVVVGLSTGLPLGLFFALVAPT